MMIAERLLAAATRGLPEGTRNWPTVGSREGMWFIISLVAVSFGFFIWAIFIRKPSRGPRYKYPHQPQVEVERETVSEPLRPHRRRRRRKERRRNPTLAETGGLPPVRSGSAASPTQPT